MTPSPFFVPRAAAVPSPLAARVCVSRLYPSLLYYYYTYLLYDYTTNAYRHHYSYRQ